MEMTAASRPKFMFFGAVLCLWFSLPLLVTFKCTKEPGSLGLKLPPFNATMLLEEYKQVFRNKAFRRYFVLSSMYTMAKGFYANSTSISSNTALSASAISTPCKRLRVRLRHPASPSTIC